MPITWNRLYNHQSNKAESRHDANIGIFFTMLKYSGQYFEESIFFKNEFQSNWEKMEGSVSEGWPVDVSSSVVSKVVP